MVAHSNHEVSNIASTITGFEWRVNAGRWRAWQFVAWALATGPRDLHAELVVNGDRTHHSFRRDALTDASWREPS